MESSEIKVLENEFNEKVEAHLRRYYRDCLGLYDWRARIEARKNEIPRAKAWLKAIEKISGLDLKDKKMLDVGCGWGGHSVAGAQLGADCTGCDVDREVLEVAELRMRLYGVQAEFHCTAAEKLPFADNKFDYVQSVSVIEHVRDVHLAIREMIRVLKPDGIGFVHAPNYQIPVEPHYKIIFPPKCPRTIAKVYLKMLARPVDFIDTINYIDYKEIRDTFENLGASISDIFKEFSIISRDYYLKESGQEKETIRVPVHSYNAFAGKLMSRGSTIAKNVFEKYFGVKNIFFLFKKNGQ